MVYGLDFDCGIIDLFFTHSYRSTSEVQAVRKEKDPIRLVEAYALDGQLATTEELKVHSASLE